MGSRMLIIALGHLMALAQVANSLPVEGKPGFTNDATGSGGFRYYIDSTTEYASAAAASQTAAAAASTTYAPPYAQISSLAGDISTTTWGNWYPDATTTATDTDDPYGQYAWSQLWEVTEFINFTRGMYSTTVSPTPVPTESLIKAPEDPIDRAFENLGIKFPANFVQGVAGSAGQIEGAVADEGRSPSILEVMLLGTDEPENYVTNENYYLYKQDIARLAAIGTEYYSFSIPWTRILPFVLPGTPVNQQGLDHYDDLINTVIEYGMKPIITMTHFDSPLQFASFETANDLGAFSVSGGYDRPEFVDAFVNYGKILMTHYADRVPIWITFNEPVALAQNALGVKHVVQASAQLHDFYHQEIQGTGQVGIKFSFLMGFPKDPTNPDDVEAADVCNQLQIDMFANPLFNGEDYPQSFKDTLLVDFPNATWSADELAAVAGKSDFLGVDPYTYYIVEPPAEGIAACQADKDNELWPSCANTSSVEASGWKIGYRSQSYVYITPKHLRVALNYLYQHWHHPVFITEFGFPEWREGEKELGDQVYDIARSIYYRSFLTGALEASAYDGVEMMGALAWSFADNWEFGDYTQQFGLQVVNRTTMERYYKKSYFDFVDFINDNREV